MAKLLFCLSVLFIIPFISAQDIPTLVLRYDTIHHAFVVENLLTGEKRSVNHSVEGYYPGGTLSPSQMWFVWHEWFGWQPTQRKLFVNRVGMEESKLILDEGQEGGGPYFWSPVEDVLLVRHRSSDWDFVERGFRFYDPESAHFSRYYVPFTNPSWTPDGQGIVAQRYFVDTASIWQQRFDRWHNLYLEYKTRRILFTYLGNGRLDEGRVIDADAINLCRYWMPSLWWLDRQTFVSLSRNHEGQQGLLWKQLETSYERFIIIPEKQPYIDEISWNPSMTHALVHFTDDCDPSSASPQLGLVSLVDDSFHMIVNSLDMPPNYVGGRIGELGYEPVYHWLSDGTGFILYDEKQFQLYDVSTHALIPLLIPQPSKPLYTQHTEPDNISLEVRLGYVYVVWSGEVWRYTLATQQGTRLATGVHRMAISPDGRFLGLVFELESDQTFCPQQVCIIDAATGNIVGSFELLEPEDKEPLCENLGLHMQWNPTSDWLLVVGDQIGCDDILTFLQVTGWYQHTVSGICDNTCVVWLPPNTPFDDHWGPLTSPSNSE